jgi:hypothetical protein
VVTWFVLVSASVYRKLRRIVYNLPSDRSSLRIYNRITVVHTIEIALYAAKAFVAMYLGFSTLHNVSQANSYR